MVVTQPDRPKGRKLIMTSSPVKILAEAHGIPVFQPAKLTPETRPTIEQARADAGVVVAYGLLLPAWLLEIPEHGFINVHPSLVPRHRGAAPVERTLFEGDRETAVSILKMGVGLDDGPVYMQERFEVPADDDAGDLRDRCARIGADLMLKTLEAIEGGAATLTDQADSGDTYAEKLTAAERWIEWGEPADRTINRIRALSPSPGAATIFAGRQLKIFRAHPLPADQSFEAPWAAPAASEPGRIVAVTSDSIIVATGTTPVAVTQVQLEGKARMPVSDFLRGHSVEPGATLAKP